jgi:hypothetical protein
MRNAEPLALVGELVIARILWNRGKHSPHQYRQQDRAEADGVSTGKGSPEVRQRWLDDLFQACLCAGSSCPRADTFGTFPPTSIEANLCSASVPNPWGVGSVRGFSKVPNIMSQSGRSEWLLRCHPRR